MICRKVLLLVALSIVAPALAVPLEDKEEAPLPVPQLHLNEQKIKPIEQKQPDAVPIPAPAPVPAVLETVILPKPINDRQDVDAIESGDRILDLAKTQDSNPAAPSAEGTSDLETANTWGWGYRRPYWGYGGGYGGGWRRGYGGWGGYGGRGFGWGGYGGGFGYGGGWGGRYWG